MRKVPKILLCIVAALMIVLGFLLFRSGKLRHVSFGFYIIIQNS